MTAIIDKFSSSHLSDSNLPGYRSHLRAWLFSWEIYLLLALSAFLRLYRIDTTEFDADQADIFRMAHDAILHGHLVATSNIASIGIYNPPGTIYLLMLPALFSANPLSGAIFTAILAILAVLLTYIFTRHFYGRLAGTLAAFFYGTAAVPIFYSRFMWNQNLLLLFVPLFIGVLFWGVVKRRAGWLGPAIFLLGLLIQLHGSAIQLSVPLLAALFLAPRTTLRWRDLFWGILAVVVIYAPYILWFIASNFLDINHLLHTPITSPTVFDALSLQLYQHFISPFDIPFTATNSVLYTRLVFFEWLNGTMTLLLIAALLLSLVQIFWSPGRSNAATTRRQRALDWWSALRTSPYRCGLVLLLLWQIVPLISFLRHTDLYPHYFIFLLPGQFILIGLFIKQAVDWLQKQRISFVPQARYGFYALAVLIIATQFVASTGSIIDSSRGLSGIPFNINHYHSDLSSMQGAINEADRLAQQHHYSRIYISADFSSREAMRFLGTQTRTPSTVFDDNCVILPGPASGPAVLLVGAYSPQANALITHFSHATLVDSPKLQGGAPFRLYIVNASDQAAPRTTLSNELQYVDAQPLNDNNSATLVTRWNLLRSEQPNDRTYYSYRMSVVNPDGPGKICTFTSMRAGDQMLVPLQPPAANQRQVNLQVSSYSVIPYTIALGFLTFDTYRLITMPSKTLSAPNGSSTLLVITEKQIVQPGG